MKRNKLKNLAVVLACTMMLGTMPSSIDAGSLPAITQTVEAAAKKVTLKASNKKVYAGRIVKINAKATKGAKLSYKTSNKKIAMVNSRGVVTGKKAGTVKITITAKKSKYKTVKKNITVKVVKQNQKITAANQILTLGQRKNLSAKAKTSLTYKSSNPKIVTVDKKGNMKALKAGSVKITVYAKTSGVYNKASKTVTVKVGNKATAAKPVTPTQKPESPKPIATPVPTKAPEPTKVPEPTKAPEPTATPTPTKTPDPTKVPEPTKAPEPTATPVPTKAPEPTATPTETPKPEVSYVTSMYFEETAKTNVVYVGESKKSTLKWEPTGNTTLKDFVFTSSNPAVATVDENGTITGVSAGDVRITATSKTPFSAAGTKDDCLTATYKYHIKVRTTEIDSIYYPSITGNEAITQKNIGIGETKDCTLKIETMGNGSISDVIFTTSDPSIATVDENGKVTGKKAGYVTITAKTKHPSEMDGQTILTDSTTYHVGDYTYEEILSGLTIDNTASKTAFNVLNELRQDKSKRPAISQDFPEVAARTWDGSAFQNAAARGGRNIICEILGGWTNEEKSTVNPLASHGYSQNGYGGSGWEATGEELGNAATEFFYDRPHAQNQTRSDEVYGAVAVVQYKNAAGISLTSMIVDMNSYPYEQQKVNIANSNKQNSTTETWISNSLKMTIVPSNQYYDICKHFGLSYGMENTTDVQADMSASEPVAIEDTFTDGSTGAVNITDSAETADAGQQEETEETEEFELSPEEETDAVSDIDVTFE